MESTTEIPTAELPTDKQRELLQKLMLSSTFTAEEAHRTAVWLVSPGATKEKASELIDKALDRINARNNSRKSSEDRKAEYHANKEQYPPQRFNQDFPPGEQTKQSEQSDSYKDPDWQGISKAIYG